MLARHCRLWTAYRWHRLRLLHRYRHLSEREVWYLAWLEGLTHQTSELYAHLLDLLHLQGPIRVVRVQIETGGWWTRRGRAG